jgi:hypothetical protein
VTEFIVCVQIWNHRIGIDLFFLLCRQNVIDWYNYFDIFIIVGDNRTHISHYDYCQRVDAIHPQ